MISSAIYRIILILILWIYGKSEQDTVLQRTLLNKSRRVRLLDPKEFSWHNEIPEISEFYWKTGDSVSTGHNTLSFQQNQTRIRRGEVQERRMPLEDNKNHGNDDIEMFVCEAEATAAPAATPPPVSGVTTPKETVEIVRPAPHVQSCHNFTIDVMKNPGWTSMKPNTDDFISFINKNQDHWEAGRNYPEDTPFEDLQRLSGNPDYESASVNDKIPIHPLHDTKDLVEFFDARIKWPRSTSIGQITDHGKCSSGSWALASTSTITDRFSIAIDTYFDFEFSAEDAMACCTYCTRDGDGCNGGEPNKVWKFWNDRGIVSGGRYKSDLGCKPYSEMTYVKGKHEKCQEKCSNARYEPDYQADRQHGKNYYRITADEAQIRAEIMINGPVQASFKVYADFHNYYSGVYIHTAGNQTGYNVVKIIGFGKQGEQQVPYWLAAYSHGVNWGREKGFFKILRGENHCGIEDNVVAGLGRQIWHSKHSTKDKKCSSNMNLHNKFILCVTFIINVYIKF